MKLEIQGPLKENIYVLMRRLGYHFLRKDKERSEYNLVRPIGVSSYPRFHIYLKVERENLIFNLHLDQKRPIYQEAPAHAGEYEGELVERESERIKQILENRWKNY